MVTYNPVPGRIYDIINVASILCDYDGFFETYKNLSGVKNVDKNTTEIFQYIRNSNVVIDADVQILFLTFSGVRFFSTFLRGLSGFYSFESITAFMTWVQNIDSDLFLAKMIVFLDMLIGKQNNALVISVDSSPSDICSYISRLPIDDRYKFHFVSALLNYRLLK